MTTIAYKNNVIAYDSRRCQNNTIVTDSCNKKHTVDNVHFFICGAVSDIDDFVESYFGKKPQSTIDCTAFVYDKGKLYKCGVDKDMKFWKCPAESPASIGSGADHAITAMDMGADAKTAVKMAMKRDYVTGGRIRTFKL